MHFDQSFFWNIDDVSDPRHQPELGDVDIEMSGLLATLRQIPLSAPRFRQSMAAVLDHLRIAGRALALGCGVSSEFRYLSETWRLPELNIVHGRYLVPLSYHLNSAWGAAELLAAGQGRPPHFALMIGCTMSIVRLWGNLPAALENLRRATSPRYVAVVDQTEQTLRQMLPATQYALAISRSAVDPAVWNAAIRASQLAYIVRDIVSKSAGDQMY